MTKTTLSTRDRILDTAEQLFSEHGISGTSLRSVTSASEVNLAAVHYHFGSKAELARAVVARRIEPLNQERLQRLRRAQESGVAQVREIAEAFVRPAIHMAIDHPEGPRFARMVARALVDPHPDIRAVLFEQFKETGPAFRTALGQALPALSDEELSWRMQFMVGAMAHTVTRCASNEQLPIQVPVESSDVVADRLVGFLVAGLSQEEA